MLGQMVFSTSYMTLQYLDIVLFNFFLVLLNFFFHFVLLDEVLEIKTKLKSSFCYCFYMFLNSVG